MTEYNHKQVESKWQKIWEEKKPFKANYPSDKPKYYPLIEFPYPSGEGLHTGHPRSYCALDVIARKKRMEGFNVLYPIGWDAFGLPTENYAIKMGRPPQDISKENIENFRRQLKSLGIGFDWDREVNTTDPKYYRWTQWIFLQLLKHGLAYKDNIAINWCPSCKIGLANEEVVQGMCERCKGPTEKRQKEQWMLEITKYADRLLSDLDDLDYLEKIKIQQRNWIGRSEGVNLRFKVKDLDIEFEMYDSIPQTFMAQTFAVIAPEHPVLYELVKGTEFEDSVMKKAKEMLSKRSNAKGIDETTEEMDGIFTGRYINYKAANRQLPIWVASFVVADYGTGIVSCSAHDERDYAFAKKFNIPLHPVLFPENPELREKVKNQEIFYREPDGILEEPVQFKGRRWDEVREDIIKYLEENKWATRAVQYKLRDWIFSRQHYWGEPIPIIYCSKCWEMKNEKLKIKNQEFGRDYVEINNEKYAIVPVPEDQLPVELPVVEKYQPTDSGESPLAVISDWVHTKCPVCGSPAFRETDTMPTWAGSSWYFLRYIDPTNDQKFADFDKLKYWLPVDLYNGGMEHVTLHLLYSRFWHKFLFDIGVVPTKEPYQKRVSHGMILAPDGQKMSKSRGNVVNPDEMVEKFGADAFRLYEMFLGPFDQVVKWQTDGIRGTYRFLEKVWKISSRVQADEHSSVQESEINKLILKVSSDVEDMQFNTAVSAMMEFINVLEKQSSVDQQTWEKFLIILSLFAPHIAEELWSELGNPGLISLVSWPKVDEKAIIKDVIKYAVQVNGKVRAVLEVNEEQSQADIIQKAKDLETIKKYLDNQQIKKEIFIKNKIISFVI